MIVRYPYYIIFIVIHISARHRHRVEIMKRGKGVIGTIVAVGSNPLPQFEYCLFHFL
jgi:hypothetical protein